MRMTFPAAATAAYAAMQYTMASLAVGGKRQ